MKHFNWNSDKNEKLKLERRISFEEILFFISEGYVVDIIKHPRQEKYPGQKIFVVLGGDYIYLVPFIETKDEIFLKTIIPSRKHTKQYLKEQSKHEK